MEIREHLALGNGPDSSRIRVESETNRTSRSAALLSPRAASLRPGGSLWLRHDTDNRLALPVPGLAKIWPEVHSARAGPAFAKGEDRRTVSPRYLLSLSPCERCSSPRRIPHVTTRTQVPAKCRATSRPKSASPLRAVRFRQVGASVLIAPLRLSQEFLIVGRLIGDPPYTVALISRTGASVPAFGMVGFLDQPGRMQYLVAADDPLRSTSFPSPVTTSRFISRFPLSSPYTFCFGPAPNSSSASHSFPRSRIPLCRSSKPPTFSLPLPFSPPP